MSTLTGKQVMDYFFGGGDAGYKSASSGAGAAARRHLIWSPDRPSVIKGPIMACLMRSLRIQGKDIVHAIKENEEAPLRLSTAAARSHLISAKSLKSRGTTSDCHACFLRFNLRQNTRHYLGDTLSSLIHEFLQNLFHPLKEKKRDFKSQYVITCVLKY